MLDKLSRKILKYVNKNPGIDLKAINNKFHQGCYGSIKFLVSLKYITSSACGTFVDEESDVVLNYQYWVTSAGKAYLENTPKEKFLEVYPQILSTIALIVSIIALLKSFNVIFS